MSQIGGDARRSTSPSIERNPPAAAEVEGEAVPVEEALPQFLAA
jgi:hypothetical protein